MLIIHCGPMNKEHREKQGSDLAQRYFRGTRVIQLVQIIILVVLAFLVGLHGQRSLDGQCNEQEEDVERPRDDSP